MTRRKGAPVPIALVPMTEEQRAVATKADLEAEAFLLSVSGHTQKVIAERLGLSHATIQKYIHNETQRRRSRAENVGDELERIAGVYESVAVEAWTSYRLLSGSTSLAGSNYLRLVLDATEKLARIRGVDDEKGARDPRVRTEVVVRLGGGGKEGAPTLELGVRT